MFLNSINLSFNFFTSYCFLNSFTYTTSNFLFFRSSFKSFYKILTVLRMLLGGSWCSLSNLLNFCFCFSYCCLMTLNSFLNSTSNLSTKSVLDPILFGWCLFRCSWFYLFYSSSNFLFSYCFFSRSCYNLLYFLCLGRFVIIISAIFCFTRSFSIWLRVFTLSCWLLCSISSINRCLYLFIWRSICFCFSC